MHAVLASLSERYPPLEGRSPTRYSPVCHSTCPLRGFRVRLACVRHAASVDSEPGSNSHVKGVSLRACARRRDSLTRGRYGSALFNPFIDRGRDRSPASGLKSRSNDSAAPRADTRCQRGCVCLHALSSFQRTRLRRPAFAGATSTWRRPPRREASSTLTPLSAFARIGIE